MLLTVPHLIQSMLGLKRWIPEELTSQTKIGKDHRPKYQFLNTLKLLHPNYVPTTQL